MKPKHNRSLVTVEYIEHSILRIRGQKVMLDSDLAALYGVPTKRLNEAVKRNSKRFPGDFMFQLTWEEFETLSQHIIDNKGISGLKSQIATSKGRGGVRKLPYAFTEQGIAMLSSVLGSERAIQVNIAIMRAFVSLRGMMRSQETIKHELTALKRQYKDHDDQIKAIFLMIDEIMAPPPVKPKRKIGFI
jgi:hypothetical protein